MGRTVELSSSQPTDDMVLRDEEVAQVMGLMTLSLICARMVRSLSWLRGWPHRCMLLIPEATRAPTLDALRADWENFQQLEQHFKSGKLFLKGMLDRSPFRTAPVRQVVLALEASRWAVSDELLSFLQEKSARLVSRQICEDGFNIMKNSSLCKGKKRYMIPGKALKAVYNREAPLAAPCSVCPGGHQPFLQSLSCSGGESGPSSSGRARSLGIPLGFVAEGERVQACVERGCTLRTASVYSLFGVS